MTKHQQPWNETITKHSQYKESEIRPCAKELFNLLQQDSLPTNQLQAVKKKFALPKFNEVSKIKLEQPPTQQPVQHQTSTSSTKMRSSSTTHHRNIRSVSSASHLQQTLTRGSQHNDSVQHHTSRGGAQQVVITTTGSNSPPSEVADE